VTRARRQAASRPPRLFVAIQLPPDVEAHLDERVDVARAALPELRWVPGGRWHITLEFLGECGAHEADRQRLRWEKRTARSSPFDMSIAASGAFPHPWRARVLFAGVRTDEDRWRRLAAYDQVPHVTLARTRQSQDLTGIVDSLSSYEGPTWRVDQIAMMVSHLRRAGERGPRYEPVEFFPLGRG
jgi:RNA 2',3'-cyclic 3'-phosphodiesterase